MFDKVPSVGDTLTTSRSGDTGTVLEVVAHETTSDLYRVRLVIGSGDDAHERWTMVKVTA